jgi:hypothetical protein
MTTSDRYRRRLESSAARPRRTEQEGPEKEATKISRRRRSEEVTKQTEETFSPAHRSHWWRAGRGCNSGYPGRTCQDSSRIQAPAADGQRAAGYPAAVMAHSVPGFSSDGHSQAIDPNSRCNQFNIGALIGPRIP